ncbi:hypothetical protein MKX01_039584 [Papaver californicum]|nr:hypothetical protein MKX01_039584 [Papaver californicum]
MSKKRGLSLEEKREKMLQIFYDSQDFYLLKELEKLGPKKGVKSQSVKDVIQSLVDDDLVLKDKIRSSIYFWSLPSCAGNQLRNVSNKLGSDLKSGKKGLDEREEALADLNTVEIKYNELKSEMGQFADNDPATLEAMKMQLRSPMQQQTDGQITSSQFGSGVPTIFLRPKSSSNTFIRRSV